MTFDRFKGGKLPPRRRMGVPALGDFLDRATSWPVVPPQGWEFAVPKDALNILGNDDWGCCAESGYLGLLQAQSYNAGRPLVPTTAEALALYSAVTGFDPNAGPPDENPTDNGTALTDLLAYAQKNGVSVGGRPHKLIGSASVDISSVAQMRWAAYTFGGLYLGLNLPAACENSVNWNFGSGEKIAGGHCVDLLGEGAVGETFRSWGSFIRGTWNFALGYLDEGYVLITEDWLNAQQKTPSGLDLDGLLSATKLL